MVDSLSLEELLKEQGLNKELNLLKELETVMIPFNNWLENLPAESIQMNRKAYLNLSGEGNRLAYKEPYKSLSDFCQRYCQVHWRQIPTFTDIMGTMCSKGLIESPDSAYVIMSYFAAVKLYDRQLQKKPRPST